MHDGDLLTQAVSFIHVMRGHQDRGSKTLAQFAQVLPHGMAGQGIKPNRGFIQKQDLWPMQHGLGNLQPPNHSSGKVSNQNITGLRQAHKIQRVERTRFPFPMGNSIDPGKQEQVFITRQAAIGR